ncbi:RNF13 family protein [Megaselia abdita]
METQSLNVLFKVFIVATLISANYGHIYVNQTKHNKLVEVFYDMPATFGPSLPSHGLRYLAVRANPADGCNTMVKPPWDDPTIEANDTFVAIIQRGNCSFEKKVRMAQSANFSAVIVYNYGRDELEPMSASNSTGIEIPSVFVTETTGILLIESYDYLGGYCVIITNESPFNINTHLIIPFSILIGLCFITMISYMVFRCIREQRRIYQHRLPKRLLKKLPIVKFAKGQPYEMCVICLVDFQEGDKLRVLFCSHAYHAVCVDPWLTKHRRFCPICKRKVFAKGERKITNQRRLRSSETDSDDDDTAPLLSGANDSGNHGTFEEANTNPSVVNVDEGISSDDESVLLNNQTVMHSSERHNPFDRAPSTDSNVNRFWGSIFGLFRRNLNNSMNTTINEGVSVTSSPSSSQYISTESITNTNPTFSITSNNVLPGNLSSSFKEDDEDLGPPHSIYEPIGDSNFIDPPSNGVLGVVALPNTYNSNLAPNRSTSDNRYFM